MPTLDFAFLADAAEAEPGRKFYVMGGGVDSIGAPAYPVVHPHLALVLRLLVHPAEANRNHVLEIRLMEPDGRELSKVEGSFSASDEGVSPGREIPMNMVLNFWSTRFEQPGEYGIEIMINNQHMKSLPLTLQLVPPAN
jgi:uncharacterized protein DUF6941